MSLVNVDTSVLFNRGLSAWIDPIHPDLSLDEAIKIDQMVEDSLQTTQDGKGKEYRLEFKKDGTPFGYVTFRVVLTASNWLNLAEQEKDRKKRLQYLTFASALSSGNSQAALQLAKAYLSLQDRKSAIAEYEKALQAEPGNLEVLQSLLDLYSATKDQQGLLATYQKILALKPNDPVIYNNLGYIYTQNR
ncbi:MAG TPA: tetratricopeptide repeat protein, partial [Thermodesulfobacteriota bacterium]|nr:tetratricopeptide repeat protein [Thermodesulfobacteriota bacterium]